MMMRKQCVIIGLFFCLTCLTSVSAEEVVTDVSGFEKMVQKWIDLRVELRSEERDWKERKEGIESQLELFAKEKESLEKEIKGMRTDMTGAQEKQAELSRQLECNQKTLDSLAGGIQRAERRLLSIVKLLPKSLSGELKKNIKALTNTDGMRLTQRAQNILSLYSEVERIQAGVHVRRELIAMENGQKKEFDVVYLGLAQAFCVSFDERDAGIGKPGVNGWHWQWDDSLVKKINKVIKIVNQKKAVEFLELPLFIKGEVL